MAKETSKSDYWCRVRWLIPTMSKEIQQDCAAGRLSVADIAMILGKDNKYQLALSQEIKLAKQMGHSVRQRQRKFTKAVRSRSRVDIHAMLADLMSRRLKPSPYKTLAWAAGDLTDEEFLEELHE